MPSRIDLTSERRSVWSPTSITAKVFSGTGALEATDFLICAAFFCTNRLDTSQMGCGQRKVCSGRKVVASPNQASKPVITDRSAPANRLMLCQSPPPQRDSSPARPPVPW